MRKARIVVWSMMFFLLLALPFVASAATPTPTLVYEGSFNLPDAGGGAHYPSYMAFAPDDPTGTNRPGWGGPTIVGPSLLVRYTNVNDTREWNALPTLSKTPGGLLNATQLDGTVGGTDYSGGQFIRDIDSAGNIWDTSFTSSTSPAGMYSNPGTHVLGGTTDPIGLPTGPYKIQETGWPGSFAVGGFLKRGSGLPTDGTATGATFVTSRRTSSGAYIEQEVRQSATQMTTTPLFNFTGTFNGSPYFIQYALATDGEEFYVLWKQGGHTGDTFTIDLYDAAATGADPTPALPAYDIGADIAAGAGFLHPNSSIDYIAVDWANSQLYVLDGGTSGTTGAADLRRSARIHVFTLEGPVAAPVAEPAGLSLMLLGLPLVLRRKKRSRKMSRKLFSVLSLVLVALLALPLTASAIPLSYEYDGSFYANSGHYGKGLTYVADGVGSGDRGGAVMGPTILTTGGHGGSDDLREWYIPALVTSGAPISATRVPYAAATDGGTNVVNLNVLGDGGRGGTASIAVMGEKVWAQRAEDCDLVSGFGLIQLGSHETWNGGTGVSAFQTYGTPAGSNYVCSGLAEKWDEADTLVRTSWNYDGAGRRVYVSKHVKGAPTATPGEYSWTTTPIFDYYSADTSYMRSNLEYVEIAGTKYYVLCREVANTAVLDFFDAATASGSVAAPDFSLDVTADITGGVGWIHSTGRIRDLAYDGANTLYLMDSPTGSVVGARVHVFTLRGAAAAPIAEPAGLSLVGLALLGIRRKRS